MKTRCKLLGGLLALVLIAAACGDDAVPLTEAPGVASDDTDAAPAASDDAGGDGADESAEESSPAAVVALLRRDR